MRFHRTPIQFEVGANVGPCFLSSAKRVDGETKWAGKWTSICITHGYKVEDPRENKDRKLNVYFRDHYFVKDISDVEWNLGYFIRVLGGQPPLDYKDLDDYINKTVEVLNELKGSEYYLKTRLHNKGEKLFLNRGFHPYVSKEKDMNYKEKEDEFHQFIAKY